MKPSRHSQSARRRAAAAAAIASVGAGILGTQSAEAGVMSIDVSSINGVNGGVTAGSFKTIYNFPTTGGGALYLVNFYSLTGLIKEDGGGPA